jgi:hypothetical protein
VKQNQLNFMGIISTREHHPYDLPSLIVLWTTTVDFWW